MLEYITGVVAELTPTYAVVDNHGLGYMLNISLATYTALEARAAEAVKLYVHEVIREDVHTLYGFADRAEREMFRLLISVSGVGAGTARIILSSLSVAELNALIMSGEHARLKSVKGIGVKTAQRVIVDLKDKIKPGVETLPLQPVAESMAYEEALAALVMLGFPRPASQKVLRKLYEADPALKVEAAIKRALSML